MDSAEPLSRADTEAQDNDINSIRQVNLSSETERPGDAALDGCPATWMVRARANQTSDVQWAQRVALTGIVDKQRGQSFVVAGPAGVGLFILFMALTSRKMQNATMTKSMIVLTKEP